MPTDELAPGQQAAAFHGLATNRAYPLVERLEMALQALDLREAEVERLRAERDDMRNAAQMYAATVDDQRRIIEGLHAEVALVTTHALDLGDRLEQVGRERDAATAEVARLRHLEDTARAWREAQRDRYERLDDAVGITHNALIAAVDVLPPPVAEEAGDAPQS